MNFISQTIGKAKRLIVFGVGRYLKNRYNEFMRIIDDDIIICYMDNSVGTIMDYKGKEIVNPRLVVNYTYDVVLLMSVSAESMRAQLLELGVEDRKIWSWKRKYIT